MKNLVTAIVTYAVVFAPGCRQTTTSQVKATKTNFMEKMRTQAYQHSAEEGRSFDAIFSHRTEALRNVNVYASFGTSAVVKVDSSILKNFTGERPVTQDDRDVSRIFIQSKAGDQSRILSLHYINQLKERQKASIIVEELVLQVKSGLKNSYDLTHYTTKEFKRLRAVPLHMNLGEMDSETTRRQAIGAAQKMKLLMMNFSERVTTSQAESFGLRGLLDKKFFAAVGVVASVAFAVIAVAMIYKATKNYADPRWQLFAGLAVISAGAITAFGLTFSLDALRQ